MGFVQMQSGWVFCAATLLINIDNLVKYALTMRLR